LADEIKYLNDKNENSQDYDQMRHLSLEWDALDKSLKVEAATAEVDREGNWMRTFLCN